jgi:nicotinamidase-related amidase
MDTLPANTALLLIDIQLLGAWRASQRPVIHIQHASREAASPLRPELPGHRIKEIVAPLPGEIVFVKQENSGFIGTGLEAYLRERGISTLVICGLTTPHCVSSTTRMAGNLGFTCYLAGDAAAAFPVKDHRGKVYDAETVHALSLATLHGEFATVTDTKEILPAV